MYQLERDDDLNHLMMTEEDTDNNDNYDHELGYSCYQVFEGASVGRQCKRDVLRYSILLLICGTSLVVISGQEDESYYFTEAIFHRAPGRYFQGTRWIISWITVIQGILYCIALYYWYTLCSNRTALQYFLYFTMIITFFQFSMTIWCLASFFTVFKHVDFSDALTASVIMPLYIATLVILFPLVICYFLHFIQNSNHLDDIHKGAAIREPDPPNYNHHHPSASGSGSGSNSMNNPNIRNNHPTRLQQITSSLPYQPPSRYKDISHMDVHGYLFDPFYNAYKTIKESFLRMLGNLRYLTWRDIINFFIYIIMAPIKFISENCESEEDRRARMLRTPATEQNMLKKLRRGSAAFVQNMGHKVRNYYRGTDNGIVPEYTESERKRQAGSGGGGMLSPRGNQVYPADSLVHVPSQQASIRDNRNNDEMPEYMREPTLQPDSRLNGDNNTNTTDTVTINGTKIDQGSTDSLQNTDTILYHPSPDTYMMQSQQIQQSQYHSENNQQTDLSPSSSKKNMEKVAKEGREGQEDEEFRKQAKRKMSSEVLSSDYRAFDVYNAESATILHSQLVTKQDMSTINHPKYNHFKSTIEVSSSGQKQSSLDTEDEMKRDDLNIQKDIYNNSNNDPTNNTSNNNNVINTNGAVITNSHPLRTLPPLTKTLPPVLPPLQGQQRKSLTSNMSSSQANLPHLAVLNSMNTSSTTTQLQKQKEDTGFHVHDTAVGPAGTVNESTFVPMKLTKEKPITAAAAAASVATGISNTSKDATTIPMYINTQQPPSNILSSNQFKLLWSNLDVSGSFQCKLAMTPTVTSLTDHFKRQGFHIVFTTTNALTTITELNVKNEIELALCNLREQNNEYNQVWFMVKFLIVDTDFSAVIKSQDPTKMSYYIKKFALAKVLLIESQK